MLTHFNKVAFRNLTKYRSFSLINVSGLAVAICVCILIGLHMLDELSYENSYPKHNNIYRLSSTHWAKSSPLLAKEFKKKMPEAVEVGRLFSFETITVEHQDKQILVERPFLGDPSILEIFDIEFIEGSSSALDAPSTVVITESMANRLFKKGENRINEVINFDDGWFLTIKGVVKDSPRNSHLQLDCIISSQRTRIMQSKDRLWAAVSIYTLFNTEEDVKKVREKLLDFRVEFLEGLMTRDEIIAADVVLDLMPITDIHLRSHREKEISINSDIRGIYLFVSLGVFILFVAIVNFVNLNMAQSLSRTKEVAIRKIIGSSKRQLILQFLLEVTILILISVFLALGLATVALPYYNTLAPIPLTIEKLFSPALLTMAFLVPLITGWLTSFIISSYMTAFNLSKASGGKELKIGRGFAIRKIMVGMQFMISLFLLIATFIVNRQIDFIHTKRPGFARDEILAIQLQGDMKVQAIFSSNTIASELKKLPAVSNVSFSSHLIGSRISIEPFYIKNTPEHAIGAPRVIAATPDYLETMGITVLQGQIENDAFAGSRYAVNERAAKMLQMENLLGETGVNDFRQREGEIVAIVNDFHFASLHQEVEPLIIQLSHEDQNALNYLLVRFQSSQVATTINRIEQTLKSIVPKALLTSRILSTHMNAAYRTENNMFIVLKIFSAIGIGLSLVGMLALFSFTTRLRTKEMGIRKTLGASALQMVLTLCRSYIFLLLIVSLVALPLAQTFATSWLENFAYRVPIKWWYLAVPTLTIIAVTASTIATQALKIAHINPVESLKIE